MKRSIDLVVNPTAGGGRAGRVLGDVSRELALAGFDVQVHATQRPGHAGEIVRGLASSPERIIAVMGGDGSFHEALAGLHDGQGNRTAADDVTLALVPAGTGGDLSKTLRLPDEPREVARYLADAKPRPFDLGEIAFVRHDGTQERRWFGNIASFGMGGLVDQIINNSSKWLGGKAGFFVATLRGMLDYRNVQVRVTVDDKPFYEGPIFSVAVANGRAFGGGMYVAPDADAHDGLFDVVSMGDWSRLEVMASSRYIYKGTHLRLPKVQHARGKVVRAETTGLAPGLLDIDGEAPGRLPATFTVLPGVIRMLERA